MGGSGWDGKRIAEDIFEMSDGPFLASDAPVCDPTEAIFAWSVKTGLCTVILVTLVGVGMAQG